MVYKISVDNGNPVASKRLSKWSDLGTNVEDNPEVCLSVSATASFAKLMEYEQIENSRLWPGAGPGRTGEP